MGFKKSNAIGKVGENYVQEIFNKNNLNCIPSNVKEFDLVVSYQLRLFKIEVKYDVMSYHTGNLAVEYFNHKKGLPSGIFASKADFYVYVLNQEFSKSAHIITLKNLIDYFNKNLGREVKGGDRNSTMRLYKTDDILSEFTKIDNLNREELILILEQNVF